MKKAHIATAAALSAAVVLTGVKVHEDSKPKPAPVVQVVPTPTPKPTVVPTPVPTPTPATKPVPTVTPKAATPTPSAAAGNKVLNESGAR